MLSELCYIFVSEGANIFKHLTQKPQEQWQSTNVKGLALNVTTQLLTNNNDKKTAVIPFLQL